MRDGRVAGLVALASLGALALSGSARAHTQSRAVATSRSSLQVTQVEYRLMLSRGIVKAGGVNLEAIDRGADPHDLHVLALSSKRELAVPELTSGQRWDGIVYLRPGIYHLWCSLPEHASRGMRATLRVVP